ncbi:hypothetical protein Tco_1108071 [Tanacetum coccineum]
MWTPLPQRVGFRCFDRPEIDTYRSQFKSLFPNKDMQEEFPDWFGSQIRQRHVDNDQDPEVSTTNELFALANGPSWTPISDAHETPLLVRDFYEEDNQHLQKAYNTNKASFKAKHWNADPTTGTYDVDAIKRARPKEITTAEWDKYIKFWNYPKNLARAAQNWLNRQKSVVISRQGSRSLARLRDEMGQASRHQDYHSNSLTTSGGTHTVDGVFPKDAGPPHFGLRLRVYPEDEIKCLLARRVVSFGRTIPGVGRVLPSTGPPGQVEATTSLDMFKRFWSGGARGVVGVVYDEDEWRMIEDDDGEEGRCVIYY